MVVTETMAIFNLRRMATVLAGSLLALGGAAQAATVTTTSFATWNSSAYITGAYSMLNFYPVAQTNYSTAAGITLTPSGSSTAYKFTGMDSTGYFLAGNSSQKTLTTSTNAGAFLQVDFPIAGGNAFLLGTSATSAKPLTMTFSDGQSFSVTSAVFGVSVSHTISWLRLAPGSGSAASISDLYFAASALPQDAPASGTNPDPTPEPATLLMTFAGGLLRLGGSRQFSSKNA